MQVVLNLHPWKNGFTFWNVSVAIYLAIFMTYWLYNCVHMMLDFWGAARIRHFTTHKLGLSERQLQSVTWPEIAHRIVLVSRVSPHTHPAAPQSKTHTSTLRPFSLLSAAV